MTCHRDAIHATSALPTHAEGAATSHPGMR